MSEISIYHNFSPVILIQRGPCCALSIRYRQCLIIPVLMLSLNTISNAGIYEGKSRDAKLMSVTREVCEPREWRALSFLFSSWILNFEFFRK